MKFSRKVFFYKFALAVLLACIVGSIVVLVKSPLPRLLLLGSAFFVGPAIIQMIMDVYVKIMRDKDD